MRRFSGGYGTARGWVPGPPAPLNHRASLGDATMQQLEFLEEEINARDQHVALGAGLPVAKHALCLLQVQAGPPEEGAAAGEDERLYVLFDLKDGYHTISPHPAYQKYMQFHLRGNLGADAVFGTAARVEPFVQNLS
eukprot:gene13256-biopygen13642